MARKKLREEKGREGKEGKERKEGKGREPIGMDDGFEAMRNDECCGCRISCAQHLLDAHILPTTQRGSRLVEYQHTRITQQRTHKRYELPLASR